MTWKLARQNLALLDHFFWLRSSRTDRYRFLKTYLRNRSERPPRVRGFAHGSRKRRVSGPSGSGGAGAAAAGRRTSILRSITGDTTWCVASRDLSTGGNPAPARRSRPAIPPAGDQNLEGLADDHGRRDDDGRAGSAHAGHLQAVQSQEVAGSAPDPVPSFACMAVVAGRPAPREPRHSHTAKPGVHLAPTIVQGLPLFWFLPHETYLITVKDQRRRRPRDVCPQGAARVSRRRRVALVSVA